MSSSQQYPQQPPHTPPRPIHRVAPFIQGNPAVQLLISVIAYPQSRIHMLGHNEFTFPVGTIGNIRSYRENTVPMDVAPSTRKPNSSGSHTEHTMRMMKVYIYSLAIVVPRTFTQERNCDLDRELVHHDNLRTVADFAINPLPRPLSRRYQINEYACVVSDFAVKDGLIIKAGTTIRISQAGRSKRGLPESIKSNLYYPFTWIRTWVEEIVYHSEYVGTDRFTIIQ